MGCDLVPSSMMHQGSMPSYTVTCCRLSKFEVYNEDSLKKFSPQNRREPLL